MTTATQTLKVTPASEWRKDYAEGVLVPLPSGNVARIRNVSMSLLIKSGRIPEPLLEKIIHMFLHGGELRLETKTSEGLSNFMAVCDAICETCFIDPKVVREVKGKGEIEVDAIEEQDKIFLYRLLSQPASELATFHHEEIPVEPVGTEQGHAPEAE